MGTNQETTERKLIHMMHRETRKKLIKFLSMTKRHQILLSELYIDKSVVLIAWFVIAQSVAGHRNKSGIIGSNFNEKKN